MDKLIQYQNAIISLIEDYAAIKPANMPDVTHEILADRDRNHFALVRLGWNKEKFVYHCVMHFDIIEGKVWLQQNWTDQNLAEELIEKGVAREDIILGFLPPYIRQHTGFAA
ncbi:MAG: XisI protein [Bacteroidia bacterium]